MQTLWWWPWPQIIYGALLLIGVGIGAAKYGQQKGTYDIVDVLIGPLVLATLLWWGGFWTGGH